MRDAMRVSGIAASCVLILVSGCNRPVYYFGDDDLSYYKHAATEIAYPDVYEPSSESATNSLPPRTLRNPEAVEVWELTLQEAIRIALGNAEVIRDVTGLEQNPLESEPVVAQQLTSPDFAPTVYDVAIDESDPRLGTEAALAAFDTQFTTSMFWSRNDQPVNNPVVIGGGAGVVGAPLFILQRDSANFQAGLQKIGAAGTQMSVTHSIDYNFSNVAGNFFPSAYTGNLEVAFTQPLLQGAGVEFNRIAGPNSNPAQVGFFSTGVLIARTRTDINIAEFERRVRDLLSQVESSYWDLYFAYRDLDSQAAGRNSALRTWRTVKAKFDTGGGSLAEEAEAREQYFLFRARVEDALDRLYAAETNLRLLIGLSANDGRLIRPADEPTTAPVVHDWYVALAEALTNRVELRGQKWRIKQAQLSLVAARNFLLPRLDFTALYRVNGLGDDLLSQDNSPRFSNVYGEIGSNDFTDWTLGFQLDVPIGFRQAASAVRNAELTLARQRAILRDHELHISHKLSAALRELDRFYTLAETNFNRRRSAERQVDAFQAEYELGRVTLDRLLDAQSRLAEAESAYYNSLVEYNKALKRVEFEKGTLLAYNNVALAEGPWPLKAYCDARERAHERAVARPTDIGITEPVPFALPGDSQHQSIELGEPAPVSTEGAAEEGSIDSSPNTDGKETEPVKPESREYLDEPIGSLAPPDAAHEPDAHLPAFAIDVAAPIGANP